MKILHIETSSKNCSVAISDGLDVLCICKELSENYKQSENLHTFIQWALEGAEISLRELDAVCLGQGPGSYTGLRIGASAAKGFCFGLQIPLIAINSLVSMLPDFIGKGYDLLLPMIDARRLEVYTAIYDGSTGREISEIESKILDESSYVEYFDKNILILGDGAQKAAEILQLPNATFKADIYPSAEFLIGPAVEKFINNEFQDIAYFNPLYLKEFQGNKMKK